MCEKMYVLKQVPGNKTLSPSQSQFWPGSHSSKWKRYALQDSPVDRGGVFSFAYQCHWCGIGECPCTLLFGKWCNWFVGFQKDCCQSTSHSFFGNIRPKKGWEEIFLQTTQESCPCWYKKIMELVTTLNARKWANKESVLCARRMQETVRQM